MNNFNTLKSYSNAFGANLPDFYNGQVRNLDRLVDGKDYFIRSMGVGNPPDSVEITKTFYYGSDGQRVLMISKEDNVITAKKYYVGEVEYTVYPSPAPAKEVTFISSPTGLIAANVKIDTTTTFYYVLTDHLGSITQLLKSNGDTVGNAQFTYDAWGRLRDVRSTNPYLLGNGQTTAFHILDRGYCGHEHLLEHDIINMNGRIYDPVVGQFMQADNYIQTPEDYIGYNRYAYCRHNPFKYTDPSGEMYSEKFAEGGTEDGGCGGMLIQDNTEAITSGLISIMIGIQERAQAMADAYFEWIKGEDDGTSFFGFYGFGGGGSTAPASDAGTGGVSQGVKQTGDSTAIQLNTSILPDTLKYSQNEFDEINESKENSKTFEQLENNLDNAKSLIYDVLLSGKINFNGYIRAILVITDLEMDNASGQPGHSQAYYDEKTHTMVLAHSLLYNGSASYKYLQSGFGKPINEPLYGVIAHEMGHSMYPKGGERKATWYENIFLNYYHYPSKRLP